MPVTLVLIAIASALLAAAVGIVTPRYPLFARRLGFGLLAVSGIAALAGGGFALIGGTVFAGQLPFGLPWLPWHVRIDPLSGFFLAIVGGVTALAAALSAACFVRLYGVAFLGQPRTRHARGARPVDPGMRLAQGTLAFLCLVFGVLPTMMIASIATIPAMLFGAGLPSR